jgi:hypothetical protein
VSSRREQLITALLVGTVVVVLGFASGIGVHTRTAGSSVGGANLTTAPVSPAPSTHPGVNYVALPAPPQPTPVAPVVAAPAAATTTFTTPRTVPRVPAASSPAPPTKPVIPAAPTCSTGLLTGLLRALLDPANGLLGLVNSIVGGAPVTGGTGSSGPFDLSALFGLLGGPAKRQQPTSLLSVVTGLLPTVLPTVGLNPPAMSRALATSCTNELSSMLPLISGLG